MKEILSSAKLSIPMFLTVFLLFLINSPMMYNFVQDLVGFNVELINDDGPTVLGMAVHAAVFVAVSSVAIEVVKKVLKDYA